MSFRHITRLVLGLTTVLWSSGLVMFVAAPKAQAANAQPEAEEIRFGSRRAIQESGLEGAELDQAVKQYLSDRQAQSVGAQAGINASSVIDAPNVQETLVQGSLTWGGLNDFAVDAAGRVVVVYLDTRDGSHANGGDSIYLRRSLDNGATWQPEVRVDNASGLGTASFGLNIATDGRGNFYIVWDDSRNTATKQIFFTRSRDGGATWSTPALLPAPSDVRTDMDLIASPSGHVFVTWEDNRVAAGDSRIYGAYSTDFGATWSADILIDDAGAGFDERFPVATYGREGEIVLAWESDRAGGVGEDVMYAFSPDGGATWQNDARLSSFPVGTETLRVVDLCSDMNGHVYNSFGAGDGTIWTNTSSDFGRTFPVGPKELTGADFTTPANSTMSTACSFGSTYAVVAFEGGTALGAGDDDVLISVSKDGGANWSAPMRANTGAPSETFDIDEIGVDVDTSGRVVVAWDDARFGGLGHDGFMNYSVDGGTTWQSTDMRFTGGTPAGTRDIALITGAGGAQSAQYEAAKTSDRHLFNMIWHDSRTDAIGIYHGAATFEGSKSSMTRLAGLDRIRTGIEISKNSYPTAGSVTAFAIATSGNFPDGLAVGPLANMIGGPVLLNPQATLDANVSAEIKRIFDAKPDGAVDAYVIGGTAALSSAVEAAIDALDPNMDVKRLADSERIGTAIAVAKEEDLLRGKGPSAAALANSANFPDALAISAPASDSAVNGDYMPVLITKTGSLDSKVSAYLSSVSSTLKTVNIAGGTAAISDGVKAAVDAVIDTVNRVSGANRYATATAIADFFYKGPLAPLSFGAATGLNFADSLTGGAHSGRHHQPLVLVQTNAVPSETHDWVSAHASTIDSGYIYGGTAAVTESVRTVLETLY
jgi:putative cell wall-binding protein